jgi:oligopeptide/dipeptide ABC transporter ATP-binding protein
VSSLDVSTQAQVINVLEELQRNRGLSYVFIGHDLSLVYHISHRVAVMYRGRIVELNSAEEVYTAARHPYTKSLLASRPSIERAGTEVSRPQTTERPSGDGEVNATGCPFVARCPAALAICQDVDPPPTWVNGGFVRCHLFRDEGRRTSDVGRNAVS